MREIELGKRFIAASGKISACWPEVAVHVPAVGIPGEREMLIALLREFGRRTAQEHRENPEVARPQLREINALARELLARRWVGAGPPSCARAGTMLHSVTSGPFSSAYQAVALQLSATQPAYFHPKG